MVHSGRYLFSSACAFRVTLVAKLLKQECLQTLQKYLPCNNILNENLIGSKDKLYNLSFV